MANTVLVKKRRLGNQGTTSVVICDVPKVGGFCVSEIYRCDDLLSQSLGNRHCCIDVF